MSSTRNNNLTPKQKRGLELVLKTLMKKYNFINGWELIRDWGKWATTIYFNLDVNVYKLSEFYNKPINNEYYKTKIDDGEVISSGSLFSIVGTTKPGEIGREEELDYSYNIKKDMGNLSNILYENLPDDMVVVWSGETGGKYKCLIGIEDFNFNNK